MFVVIKYVLGALVDTGVRTFVILFGISQCTRN